MQQDVPIPPVLLQMNRWFEASSAGKHRQETRPGPMGQLCFRFFHIRESLKDRGMADTKPVNEAAIELDHDLATWATALPDFAIVNAPPDASSAIYFEGKRHIYGDTWVSQVWNNWRALRILVNKILLQDKIRTGDVGSIHAPQTVLLIRQLSRDICMAFPSFVDSPRKEPQLLAHQCFLLTHKPTLLSQVS